MVTGIVNSFQPLVKVLESAGRYCLLRQLDTPIVTKAHICSIHDVARPRERICRRGPGYGRSGTPRAGLFPAVQTQRGKPSFLNYSLVSNWFCY